MVRPKLALVSENSKTSSRKSPRRELAGFSTRRTWVNSKGYLMVYAPQHPNANRNGAMMAHRYVASQALGRPLAKDERVHHKLPNRRDKWPNPDELEIWIVAHPSGQRATDIADHARRQLAEDLRARRDRRTLRGLKRPRWPGWPPLTLDEVLRDEFPIFDRDIRAALKAARA